MPLLREPARNPLARTIARVLILALVAGLTPIEARAARTTTLAEPSLPTPHERECPVRVNVWVVIVVGREPVTKDPVGNRQSQVTALGPAGSPGPNLQPGTISYGYDTRDRLLQEQLSPNPATAYAWDSNGNLTTKDAEATYSWDHENRLVRVAKTDGTLVEHSYDVDGNRVRTATTPPGGPTTATDFLVDTSGSLSHVVAEVDGSAATPTLQALYIRGDDLLSVMRPLVAVPASAGDWQTRYYHADGIGSIRRLTDETGTITDGYTYDAFGELLAHNGSDPNPTPSPASRSIPTPASSTTELAGWIRGRSDAPGGTRRRL
jgi:YD repeat-containing protein